MTITGNKGEWSEIYAFLRLLADGKLFAADENLNKINNMFFPIIKIIREESTGMPYEYRPNSANAEIEIYLDNERILCLPAKIFETEANYLLEEIIAHGQGSGSFGVEKSYPFIRSIYVNKLKAPTSDKSDINIQIHDINTGFEKVAGFSIKSELGMPPTLLNAGRTTNFIYKIDGLDLHYIDSINAIDTSKKIKDRIKKIICYGGRLIFCNMENDVFKNNLIMIDSQMPHIVAEMLVGYYSEITSKCAELTEYVNGMNPLNHTADFYRHKIKELLCAAALGMKPATMWDGTDEASGGYIIVRTNGDVLAYHIYNRDAFKRYLLNNTKFESGSSSRHGYGILYEQNGEIFIKLNLQIRFI